LIDQIDFAPLPNRNHQFDLFTDTQQGIKLWCDGASKKNGERYIMAAVGINKLSKKRQ
jgi:hypothetical protein